MTASGLAERRLGAPLWLDGRLIHAQTKVTDRGVQDLEKALRELQIIR
jgi:hypothetical protein